MSRAASEPLRVIDAPLPPGKLVVSGRRLLAGVGNNAHRAWVFPLCTPSGLNTVQEYAFDHPFHNGVFVGQAGVWRAAVESNFWVVHADPRQVGNPLMQRIGTLSYPDGPRVEAADGGCRFGWRTTWMGSDGAPVLDEERRVDIALIADAVACDVVSSKRAAYGPLRFAKTKCGAIGARVQPQLVPVLGGEILAIDGDALRRGTAEAALAGQPAEAIAYENELPGGGRFGICLLSTLDSTSSERRGPWFARDYGMAMYNPTLQRDIELAADAVWTTSLRLVAYDGALTPERARCWQPTSG